MKLFDKETATQLERIERIWAVEDCKKLMGKLCLYLANGDAAGSLETLWVTEPEHRKTMSYGRNWGFFYGYDEVRRCFAEVMKAPEKGYVNFTNYSTWSIQMARDGQSAYSVWAATPVESFVQNGKPVGWKSSEKICCNFVREEDGWKIWKLFVGTEMSVRAGDDLTQYPCDLEPDAVELPRMADFETATIRCEAFTNRLNIWNFPPLPVEHDTWTPELSCGPEGHPTAKEAL